MIACRRHIFFLIRLLVKDYTLIDFNGHIFGFVLSSSDHISSDGDWNIQVVPDAPPSGFQSNVTLSTPADFQNQEIECEICDKCTALLRNRLPIGGDQVQFDGIRVLDNGHDSKTEIHPITQMQIQEMGASRPRPGEEIFRLAVGAGGACPQGVLRVASPLPQGTNELITLSWPAPPTSATAVFTPAFDITEVTNGTPQALSVDLGSGAATRTEITRDGNFTGTVGPDRFPIAITRSGLALTMGVGLQAFSGTLSFDTPGRVFDVHTTWDPSDVKVVIDGVTDQHIILDRSAHPFKVRRYEVAAHIDPAVPNVNWLLHAGATGYSTPGPQLVGSGSSVQFNVDIAPSQQLKTYDFGLEAQGPNGLSVFGSPVHLPHPSLGIREVADTETCKPIASGGEEHHVAITLAAQAANFASGPNISWALAPDPLPAGQQPATVAGPQIMQEFVISPNAPQNRYNVSATAADLDNVETATTEGDQELLYFQPQATLICQPLAFPKWRVTVLTTGTCGSLRYKWYTGATTDNIEITNASLDPVQVGVNVTDDAGQSIDILANVCENSYIERRRSQLMTSVDLLGKLLMASKLIPLSGPPGPPGPESPDGLQLWGVAKFMAMTARGASAEIIAQRAGFLNGILLQVEKTPASEQAAVLKGLAEQRMKEVRSRKYVETRGINVAIPVSEWNPETAKDADARAKEILPRLRPGISR
jgi:hypothetical protein